MKKKIFIGIAMSLFAVATVFNLSISKQSKAGDVSLEAIKVMAQAQEESNMLPEVTVYACSWLTEFDDPEYPNIHYRICIHWTSTTPCSNEC